MAEADPIDDLVARLNRGEAVTIPPTIMLYVPRNIDPQAPPQGYSWEKLTGDAAALLYHPDPTLPPGEDEPRS